MNDDDALVLGVDIGTSAVRCVALDRAGELLAQAHCALPPAQVDGARITQDPTSWWQATDTAIGRVTMAVDAARIAAIAVAGTSGTVLLTNARGEPLTAGWMYAESSCRAEAEAIAAVAPAGSTARGLASPLARLLHLQTTAPAAHHLAHQADWLTGRLTGRSGLSDENNVLKLGYDLCARGWPGWFAPLGVRLDLLPEVVVPGTPIGHVLPALARRWGWREDVLVGAGTTDGVAAFLATGASRVGDAVSSLGSTLVLKLLSAQPVTAPACGIYSHRLGDLWLPGGASNSGGAALLRHFDLPRIEALSPRIDPEHDSGLDYHPLPRAGERFPIADPTLPSRTAPRPADDVLFLQGLLEGVAAVEAQGYARLAELGAGRPSRLFSVGGGTRNPAWSRIRERRLGMPLTPPRHQEAACGAALLARRALDAAG